MITPEQFREMEARNESNKLKGLAADIVKLHTPDAVLKESDLHDEIVDECKRLGWLAFHGSMAHRAMRTIGEPDFTILADRGRVFFIEAKSKTGKLRPEQIGLAMMAEKLGHKITVVRTLKDFLTAVNP